MDNNRTKVFLVVPTIRDLVFFKSWEKEFKNCHLIVVEDHQEKKITIPNNNFLSVNHFTWKNIDDDLGKSNWIISRQNAGIRNYGFLKAYQMGADVIITLDDDCFPIEPDFIKKHLQNLNLKAPMNWQSTYPDPKWMFTRGFPYKIRNMYPVMVSHGLWSGALDLDAKTEIKLPKLLREKPYPPIAQFIPPGTFYPMCSMNLAFKREVVPFMFFPMMGFDPSGKAWGYDRYDDIWAGLFSKKIMDHLNMAVVNGSPFVDHRKASIIKHNHKKEFKGMKTNEELWKTIQKVKLTGKTAKECYIELAKKTKFPKEKYFEKLKKAMIIWANMF